MGRVGDRTMANLIEININEIFKTNQDVRNWLLENPRELEDALNIELVNIGHHSIIPDEVRPDIYAEENMSHNKVIVMINLDEPTDEDFKNLLAIAAGNNANKAVWLVKSLDDKTRYILNWLNERAGWKTEFIVMKVEAYKINDSLPAVKLVRI